MEKIGTAAEMVQAPKTEKKQIFHELNKVVRNAILSLDSGDGGVTSEVAGDLVVDIGLGLGFDLIDGRTPEDQENLASRQARLLESEQKLQGFIASGGKNGSLKEILKGFMGK